MSPVFNGAERFEWSLLLPQLVEQYLILSCTSLGHTQGMHLQVALRRYSDALWHTTVT